MRYIVCALMVLLMLSSLCCLSLSFKLRRLERLYFDLTNFSEYRCSFCALRSDCYPYEADIRPDYPCDNFCCDYKGDL